VRAVEFVLDRCGLQRAATKPETRQRRQTIPPVPSALGGMVEGLDRGSRATGLSEARDPGPVVAPVASALKATIDSWPYAIVDNGDHAG
jgi:hypothetical protein